MSGDLAESDLLAKACGGDRVALERLLVAHCTPLARHIAAKIPSSFQGVLSPEDILQQTLFRAFRGIDRYKPTSASSFSVWLKTIAENELRNTLGALTRKKRGGDRGRVPWRAADGSGSLLDLVEVLSGGGGTPSRSAMRREAVEAVQVGMAGLPEDQREAIRLHFLEGRSLDETAAAMGRTYSAVRSLIHRAKQNLRAMLGRSSRWLLSK
jgi:RNA polymerase sigma-70 factor (ECF subfamily)